MKLNVVAMAVTAVLIQGCGILDGSRGNDDFARSQAVEGLEIPPDLTVPKAEKRVAVANLNGVGDQGGSVAANSLQSDDRVASTRLGDIRLVTVNGLSWLEVNSSETQL